MRGQFSQVREYKRVIDRFPEVSNERDFRNTI